MAVNMKNKDLLKQISPKLSEECLQRYLRMSSGVKDINLVKYDIGGSDTAKGDSYLSIVTRLKVEGLSLSDNKTHTLSLIVKGLPANIGRRKTFRSCEFFRNEVNFYNEVLPRFLTFQEKKKLQKPFVEIPRCYEAFADGENDFVIMEDVSHSGFVAPKRQEGFDYEHCCAVLQIMGRFHALSLAMKDQEPEEFKKAASSVKETYYYSENKPWYADMLRRFTDILSDAVSKELPGTVYEEKLKMLTDDDFYDRLTNLVKPKEPYAVVGHGDTWCPNFLFRYKKYDSSDQKNEIEDVRVIDFQLARYGSPVLDLSFMIYSCTTKELLNSHYDNLLQCYYQSVCEFLTDLGSSPETIFSYKNFQSEVSAYFLFGLGMSLESVPLSLVDNSEAPDLELIKGDQAVPITDAWVVHPIKTKEGRLRLSNIFKHGVDHGFL
ncbi:uncharacterized protein [Anabrus simplex]|uniref:uncharacterized protein n=1 Tax=Anabrus simplex TaxID=316456 RepID=UPI0034DD6898